MVVRAWVCIIQSGQLLNCWDLLTDFAVQQGHGLAVNKHAAAICLVITLYSPLQ